MYMYVKEITVAYCIKNTVLFNGVRILTAGMRCKFCGGESCFLIIGLLILEFRFWPTRKRSQAPQDNFFARISLNHEPWLKYHIHYMFCDLEEIWYPFDDMNVNHFKYQSVPKTTSPMPLSSKNWFWLVEMKYNLLNQIEKILLNCCSC